LLQRLLLVGEHRRPLLEVVQDEGVLRSIVLSSSRLTRPAASKARTRATNGARAGLVAGGVTAATVARAGQLVQ
jgi:hypothetical protein